MLRNFNPGSRAGNGVDSSGKGAERDSSGKAAERDSSGKAAERDSFGGHGVTAAATKTAAAFGGLLRIA
jgi:hypothetical protein